MKNWGKQVVAAWDRFLFESCDPRIVPVIRVGFAILIVVQTCVAWVDAEFWFTDAGVLRVETAKRIMGSSGWSLFYVLPSTGPVIRFCLIALIAHSCMLLLGIWSRFQAVAIFLWLVSFQNRNPFIHDGEDTVFRLVAFMIVWLPLDAYWSVRRSGNGRSGSSGNLSCANRSSAWALRLIQIEMTAIYASTAISKLCGETWRDGTALWYVSRMTDNFGRGIPSDFFDYYFVSAVSTWGTLLIEASLPLALWFRPTRKYAILVGVGLHLAIEFSMNLFLFQWIMILGLMSFVVPSEWGWRVHGAQSNDGLGSPSYGQSAFLRCIEILQ